MKDLSLIIPCYNEGKTLRNSLDSVLEVLKLLKMDFEIILIDDNSNDSTRKTIENFSKKHKIARAFYHKQTMGRGFTVKEGIKKAKGKIAGFIDIDLEVPIESIIPHIFAIKKGFDVSYANRITKFSFLKIHRNLLHKGYIFLTKLFLGTPFNDTNAGCKFFKRKKILPVLRKTESNHWFWDTEILTRSYFAGLKMKEIPVLYMKRKEKKSSVKIFRDTLYFLKRIISFSKKIKELKK